MQRCGVRVALLFGLALSTAIRAEAASEPQRIKVAGEIIDSWCQLTGIMGPALGTAHHQCAVWCAVGGVPVGIQGDDGKIYILLKVDGEAGLVGNPTIVDIQTDRVVADADHYERYGVNYLVVTKVLENHGIVNLT